jgi:hypothetical protein
VFTTADPTKIKPEGDRMEIKLPKIEAPPVEK